MTFFACALSALLMHEAAHALMCLARGVRVRGVVISRRGIGIRREAGTQADTVWIALAGPVTNLLLAALFWWSPFSCANLVLGIVNLLPLAGSDGRRAVEALRLAWRAT